MSTGYPHNQRNAAFRVEVPEQLPIRRFVNAWLPSTNSMLLTYRLPINQSERPFLYRASATAEDCYMLRPTVLF